MNRSFRITKTNVPKLGGSHCRLRDRNIFILTSSIFAPPKSYHNNLFTTNVGPPLKKHKQPKFQGNVFPQFGCLIFFPRMDTPPNLVIGNSFRLVQQSPSCAAHLRPSAIKAGALETDLEPPSSSTLEISQENCSQRFFGCRKRVRCIEKTRIPGKKRQKKHTYIYTFLDAIPHLIPLVQKKCKVHSSTHRKTPQNMLNFDFFP